MDKGNLPFKGLLEESGFARSTLARHLKYLIENGKIEKFYNIYRISQEMVVKAQIESMIQNLGKVATHQIVRTKLNLPVEFDIENEMFQYERGKPKNVSWKELFEFLEKEYPLIIRGRKK